MASEPLTGALLRTLAASKPNGEFLEIGTGTGIGTCWILDGMDAQSRLTSIEKNPQVFEIAKRYLGDDLRVQFVNGDAEPFIQALGAEQFDFIFVDSFPGKFYLLDEVLNSLKTGGFYVVDDLLPQVNWPESHQSNVDQFIAEIESRHYICSVALMWASGILLITKIQ
ncbi:MAG: class I SAM-dependent methyltransferase [Chloroflexota bacterium]